MPPSKRTTAMPGLRGGKQKSIAQLLGQRITKPRAVGDGSETILKKPRKDPGVLGLDTTNVKLCVPSELRSAHVGRESLKDSSNHDNGGRKRRSSEALSDVPQLARRDVRGGQPNFAKLEQSEVPKESNVPTKKRKSVSFSLPTSKEQPLRRDPFEGNKCIYNVDHDDVETTTRNRPARAICSRIPKVKKLLPQSHLLLFDALVSLEAAIALLESHSLTPTLANIRNAMSKRIRREFTVNLLSQLAHLVPEVVAVFLECENGTITPHQKPAGEASSVSDRLLVRLDVVPKEIISTISHGGFLAQCDCASRDRRVLLHKRLSDHVRESHSKFTRRRGLKGTANDDWQPDFDIDIHVSELPAPPLYGVGPQEKTARASSSALVAQSHDAEIDELLINPNCSAPNKYVYRVRCRDDDGCVGNGSGMESIRNGNYDQMEVKDTANAGIDGTGGDNCSLLESLPCTMDVIQKMLKEEKRSAMGWSVLLVKLEKLHPKQLAREDLEVQLNAITTLGTKWCSRVELRSASKGFAFRVLSDAEFGEARSAVCSVLPSLGEIKQT